MDFPVDVFPKLIHQGPSNLQNQPHPAPVATLGVRTHWHHALPKVADALLFGAHWARGQLSEPGVGAIRDGVGGGGRCGGPGRKKTQLSRWLRCNLQ